MSLRMVEGIQEEGTDTPDREVTLTRVIEDMRNQWKMIL